MTTSERRFVLHTNNKYNEQYHNINENIGVLKRAMGVENPVHGQFVILKGHMKMFAQIAKSHRPPTELVLSAVLVLQFGIASQNISETNHYHLMFIACDILRHLAFSLLFLRHCSAIGIQ